MIFWEYSKRDQLTYSSLSRGPLKEKLGSYIFYLKAEIAHDDKRMGHVVKELKNSGQ